jgi:hypothetical protein
MQKIESQGDLRRLFLLVRVLLGGKRLDKRRKAFLYVLCAFVYWRQKINRLASTGFEGWLLEGDCEQVTARVGKEVFFGQKVRGDQEDTRTYGNRNINQKKIFFYLIN